MDKNNIFSNLPPFTCAGTPVTERREKWIKWKRGFEICLRAAKITVSSEKKDFLLAQGGFELQEIFFSIPGADVEADEKNGIVPYDVAIKELDKYFAPLRHEAHERFIFWGTKLEPDEGLGKFLLRLQSLASKCNFGKSSSESAGVAVIDKMLQLVPGQLREKLLQQSELTLEELTKQVNAFEATRLASAQIGGQAVPQAKASEAIQRIRVQCTFCGTNHWNDERCPALDKTCSKCKGRGHYRAVCPGWQELQPTSSQAPSRNFQGKRSYDTAFKSTPSTSKFVPSKSVPSKFIPSKKGSKRNSKPVRRLHAVDDQEYDDDDQDNVELVEMVASPNDSDDLIWATVGGVLIEMQIDSGVQSNIIDCKTWQAMVQNGVRTLNGPCNPDRRFKAYAQKDCLTVSTMFDAEISISDGSKVLKATARFYVVKDGPQPLLGKNTSKKLGVLVVGLPSQREIVQRIGGIRPFPSIRGVKIHIPVDKSVTPVSQRLRRLPFATLERVEEKLNELLSNDIIEPVSEPSRWVSPIVVVVKDNGDIRLCVDMRQVNKAVLRETHPLPTIEDIRWKLNGAKYFSRLDIKDAFHQLALDDESKPLTTFITHKGLYRYKRLMFGISSAPESFQKELEQILAGCKNAINFIDDIIVFGSTEEEHDEALRLVLQKLRDFDVLLNQSKCAFKLTEIDFLGHHFNERGMTPARSKIEAIQSCRAPENKEELRSFLGFVNYVGTFIPDLATISFPLRELTKSTSVFQWEGKHQEAFAKLKGLIGRVEALSHFDPKLKTRVVADASPVGLGAVLLQFFEGKPKVVAYASKSLTETERRYAQTEKEALALVWCVEKFQIYLLGIRFELETDHKPLEAIFSPDSAPCLRIERWVLRLMPFSYQVVYRKGKSNIADPLSRLSQPSESVEFDPDSNVYIRSVAELTAIDISELETASSADEELTTLRECLNSGHWNYSRPEIKPYHAFRNELGIVGELVVRGSRLIIPKDLRPRMLELAHEGHPGITKMAERLRNNCWWPGMDGAIAKTVDSCKGCRLVTLPDRPEPMKRREMPEAPWIDVAIDFLGPLPSGEYLLVIIDYFSRYKEVEIMKKITSSETADRLEHIFVRLGYPRTITLDNGRQFVSAEFENYCKQRGIVLNKTTPYWPQENGLVERQNRSLVKRLKICQAEKRDWKKELLVYLTMYYSTPQSTTNKTPSALMFGREIRTKIPSLRDVGTAVPSTDYRDRDKELKDKGKEREDLRRKAKASNITVGDNVLMKNVIPGNKLTPTFGPTVMTVKSKEGARVTVQDTNSGKSYVRNSTHLKKAAEVYEEDDDDEPFKGFDTPSEMTSNGSGADRAENSTELSTPGLVEDHERTPAKDDKLKDVDATTGRPRRAIKRPDRLNDCVIDY